MSNLEEKLKNYRGSIYHYSNLALSHSIGTIDKYKLLYYHLYRQIDIILSLMNISSYRNQMLRDWLYEQYFKHPDMNIIGKNKFNRIHYYLVKHLLLTYGYEITKSRINKLEDEKLKKKLLRILDFQYLHFKQ